MVVSSIHTGSSIGWLKAAGQQPEQRQTPTDMSSFTPDTAPALPQHANTTTAQVQMSMTKWRGGPAGELTTAPAAHTHQDPAKQQMLTCPALLQSTGDFCSESYHASTDQKSLTINLPQSKNLAYRQGVETNHCQMSPKNTSITANKLRYT